MLLQQLIKSLEGFERWVKLAERPELSDIPPSSKLGKVYFDIESDTPDMTVICQGLYEYSDKYEDSAPQEVYYSKTNVMGTGSNIHVAIQQAMGMPVKKMVETTPESQVAIKVLKDFVETRGYILEPKYSEKRIAHMVSKDYLYRSTPDLCFRHTVTGKHLLLEIKTHTKEYEPDRYETTSCLFQVADSHQNIRRLEKMEGFVLVMHVTPSHVELFTVDCVNPKAEFGGVSLTNLIRGMRMNETRGYLQYECTECGKKFQGRKGTRDHYLQVHNHKKPRLFTS